VRTTVDLDADVLGLAKQLAAKRGLTAGQVISDLLRQALAADPKKTGRIRNGVPLFESVRKGPRANLALVNKLRDGE